MSIFYFIKKDNCSWVSPRYQQTHFPLFAFTYVYCSEGKSTSIFYSIKGAADIPSRPDLTKETCPTRYKRNSYQCQKNMAQMRHLIQRLLKTFLEFLENQSKQFMSLNKKSCLCFCKRRRKDLLTKNGFSSHYFLQKEKHRFTSNILMYLFLPSKKV